MINYKILSDIIKHDGESIHHFEQGIIWAIDDFISIGPLARSFREIRIKIKHYGGHFVWALSINYRVYVCIWTIALKRVKSSPDCCICIHLFMS